LLIPKASTTGVTSSPEPDRFEADLYATLGVTAAEFDDLSAKVKRYRNKFVAHLDEKRTMHRPMLEQQRKAIEFLFERLPPEAHGLEDWRREGLPWVYEQAFQQAHSAEALKSG
jgi:hypothetical protein